MSSDRDTAGVVVVDPLGGLLLDPSNELRFKGPFDDYVTVSLSIRNPTEKRIAFKIKTTAPKRYCVKPNSGVLDSNQSMKVNVLLQPFNYDPNEKNKHKFMVQYMYLNEQEMQLNVNDILNMWKDVPTSRLLDLKLKCIFEFTEAEQARLQHLQPQSDTSIITNQSTVQKPQTNSSSASSTTSRQSSNTTQSSKSINSSTADVYSNAADSHANDFESMPSLSNTNTTTNLNTNTTSNPTNVRTVNNSGIQQQNSKNDNILNELKLAKQENEALRKEINRLKEEEVRLKKLALQSPVSSSSRNANDTSSLSDILNNRLVLIIIILIAIIVYLLLFR